MAINYSEGGTSNNGRIIQVVNTADYTRRKYTNFTGNSFTDTYTHVNTTITPKLATSKLLFFVDINYGVENNTGSIFFQMREGSTIINALNGSGNSYGHQCFHQRRWSHHHQNQAEYNMKTAVMNGQWTDANNTNARTYKIYIYCQTGGLDFTINRDGSNASDNQTGNHSPQTYSNMTIMEVSDV